MGEREGQPLEEAQRGLEPAASSVTPVRGSSAGALAQLAATGQFTPEAVATVVRRYPGDRDQILSVLYRGPGTQFVLQVVAALNHPVNEPPQTRGPSPASTSDAILASPAEPQPNEPRVATPPILDTMAVSIRQMMDAADLGWDSGVVNLFEQADTTTRIALQRRLDMEKLIGSMSDFEASRLGTLGPVTAGQDKLNLKRAAYIKQAIDDYPPDRAEVFVLFALRGAYNDDAYAILAELANQRRISRLMAMPNVADQIHARGIDASMFGEPSESWTAGVRGLGRGIKHFVKDDRPGKYQGQRDELPGEDAALLWQMDMAELEAGFTVKNVALGAIDQVTFGFPHGMVDLGRDTVSAVGDAAYGNYELAGEKLTGAAIVLLTHLGVKAWKYARRRTSARRQAGQQPAPAESQLGLKGPEGPGQFNIPNFEGPITAEEAKLGAIFELNPGAQAAMGRLIARIGRAGLEQVAAFVEADNRAALFVAENGEAAVYALLEANGDVAAATTKLPSRQLAAGSSQHDVPSQRGPDLATDRSQTSQSGATAQPTSGHADPRTSIAARTAHAASRYTLGEKLGSGGEKDVYAVVGREDIAIGVAREPGPAAMSRLAAETALIENLGDLGLPVVQVLEIIEHDAHPAVVMKRFAQGSKSVVRTIRRAVKIVGESPLLNERSINDLQRIREVMQSIPIRINDLQFLIAEDGSIVVADVLGYAVAKPSATNIATINRLIEAATNAIAKKKGTP